ncbi:hypothetical protein BGC07_05080 [Piscirickettsia litoralis]|uniref:Uncharacterized protein n=2 Tax=Piscirickettsia litoralis TaxID=1891921 RepID=A0ABX3A1Q2_9GAMM|nr:hypothetical protein BGC07_05080 [Piscirickettsia litoralis]
MERECKKLLGIAVLGLFTAASYATPQISSTYTFEPNKPVTINNPLFFSISASCKISVANPVTLHGVMLKGSGKLNGKNVGSGLDEIVNNGDVMSISASGLAKVQITNTGSDTVTADCSLGKSSTKAYEKYQFFNK